MEKFDIVDFAHTKAKRIAEILIERYDTADFEVSGNSIFKELQERATQEARSCFILNTEAKFDEVLLKTLDSLVQQRIKRGFSLKHMDIEEKLSFVITYFAEDYLNENDRMFLF